MPRGCNRCAHEPENAITSDAALDLSHINITAVEIVEV